MTRKRFKKLLMAHGYQSREAEFAALCAMSEYGEYRLAWNNKWHALAVMRSCCNMMEDSWEGVRDVLESIIAPMLDWICEKLRPLTDAHYEALNGRESEGEPYE